MTQESIVQKATDILAKHDLTMYDASAKMADVGDRSVKLIGNSLAMRYELDGNTVSFTVKVPSGIRTGLAAAAAADAAESFWYDPVAAVAAGAAAYDAVMSIPDPTFTVRFDADVTVNVSLPSELNAGNPRNMAVTSVQTRVLKATIDATNFPGDFVRS